MSQIAGAIAMTPNMAHNVNVLRFGAPSFARMRDDNVFVTLSCSEDVL